MCPTSPKKSKADVGIAAHPVLEEFTAIGQVIEPVTKDDLAEYNAGDPVKVYLYRIEPKEYQGPPAMLDVYDGAPTFQDIKARYGGGRYSLRVRERGQYRSGSVEFAIPGRPRDPDEVSTGESNLGHVVSSAGTGENAILAVVDRMRQDILEAVKGVHGDGVGRGDGNRTAPVLDAARLSELIDTVNYKMAETSIIRALYPGDQKAAPAGPAFDVNMITQIVTAVVSIFKAGARYAAPEGSTDVADGLIEKGLDLINRLTAPASRPGIPAPAPATSANTERAPAVPENIEAERQQLEREAVKNKAAKIEGRLRAAVDAMLTALDADVDYSDGDVVDFVRQVISEQEIALVADHLTFENVRALMFGDVDAQVGLDTHKDRVERVLALLQGRNTTADVEGEPPEPPVT